MAEEHNDPSEWWDQLDGKDYTIDPTEAYCITCWWHTFDDENNTSAKVHKIEFKNHLVKTKAGLNVP